MERRTPQQLLTIARVATGTIGGLAALASAMYLLTLLPIAPHEYIAAVVAVIGGSALHTEPRTLLAFGGVVWCAMWFMDRGARQMPWYQWTIVGATMLIFWASLGYLCTYIPLVAMFVWGPEGLPPYGWYSAERFFLAIFTIVVTAQFVNAWEPSSATSNAPTPQARSTSSDA